MTDSQTNKVLAAGVREISGDELENVREKLQAQKLNKGFENAGKDIVAVMKQLFGK